MVPVNIPAFVQYQVSAFCCLIPSGMYVQELRLWFSLSLVVNWFVACYARRKFVLIGMGYIPGESAAAPGIGERSFLAVELEEPSARTD